MYRMKTGWKVLRRRDDSPEVLCSATNLGRVLSYELNKWTLPHKSEGPCVLFGSLPDAESFQKFSRKIRVIKRAVYTESDSKWLWTIDEFGYRCTGVPGGICPAGTVFADAVMLVE